ncbi:hypothetical protein [Amaricoccus solimangrovi]|uniref:Uncharacterized protein n=1 Tax=Amaricoccus solimangrovi TaxID=2589815 RepID=A0A501WUI7_9RHOB|nr:hypothetical protein [Amaricoccus solimangrovi]TPE49516.1 hypothetical protein FJM51_14115 [Amaricoccus solimangrovi]
MVRIAVPYRGRIGRMYVADIATHDALALVGAVESGTKPEVGFGNGRLAPVLAEAALRLATEGRPVKVSEIG